MTPASATNQQGMDLRYYWLLIRQKLWVIVPCAIVGSTIGLIQAVQTRPLYQATVQLLIEGENPNVAASDTGVPPEHAVDYCQTQYQSLPTFRGFIPRLCRNRLPASARL
jgi:uncharacterized protein involved in exopolysaccharide biosynthesis